MRRAVNHNLYEHMHAYLDGADRQPHDILHVASDLITSLVHSYIGSSYLFLNTVTVSVLRVNAASSGNITAAPRSEATFS